MLAFASNKSSNPGSILTASAPDKKKVSVSMRGGLLLGLQPLLDFMYIPPHGTHTDLEALGEAGVVVPGLG